MHNMTTVENNEFVLFSTEATPHDKEDVDSLFANENFIHEWKDDSLEYRFGIVLWTYVCPIIVFLGFCGNLLSFLVFFQNPLRHSVFSLYIRVLAVSDTGVLVTLGLHYWMKVVFNINITSKHAFLCKMWTMFRQMCLAMSGWVLLALAIDRVIGVYWPHRYKHISTKKKASVVLMLIGVTMFSFGSAHLSNTLVTEHHPWFPNQTVTSCKIKNSYYMQNIMPWLLLCMYTLVPFVVILACNVSIIYKVTTAAHHLSSTSQDSHVSNMTKILLIISLVYLVSTGPLTSFFVYVSMFPTRTLSIKELRTFFLLEVTCKLLAMLNNATNFIWYCISGSTFRNQLKACC